MKMGRLKVYFHYIYNRYDFFSYMLIFIHTHALIIFCVVDTYSLKPGVFLFLGYSEKDEALLKGLDIIQFEIGDLVYTIQKFIQDHIKSNVSTCQT